MNSARKNPKPRFLSRIRLRATPALTPIPSTRSAQRKEGLVLLAIAALFVANVLLYVCHHYGLTSMNDPRPRTDLAPRVIID